MKTRLITTLDKTGLLSNRLYIHKDISNDEYYLAYNNSDREIKIKLDNSSKNKVIFCSELIQNLIDKYWLNPKKLSINDIKTKEGNFDVKLLKENSKSLDPIYSINSDNSDDKFTYLTISDLMTDSVFNELWDNIFTGINEGESIKSEIENMTKSGEIYLFNTSKKEFDFLKDQNTLINLIEYGSDIYTSSVDIKSIINSIPLLNDLTSKIDLSIQYSIKNSEHIYNFDTSFNGFSYVDDSIKFNNFTQTINNLVILEYIDGIIRLFPRNESIKECIISNCTITYGNLRQ